jgi:hypothetical protein
MLAKSKARATPKLCYARRKPPQQGKRTRLTPQQLKIMQKTLALAISSGKLARPGVTIPEHVVQKAHSVVHDALGCINVTPRTVRRALSAMQRPKRAATGTVIDSEKWRTRKQNGRSPPARCNEDHLELNKGSTPSEICGRLRDIGAYRTLGSRVKILMLQGLAFNQMCMKTLLETLAQRPQIFCVNLGEISFRTNACWTELHSKLVSRENGVVLCFVDTNSYKGATTLFRDLGIKRRGQEEGWRTSTLPPLWRRASTLRMLEACSPVGTPASALWGMASWHPKQLRPDM